MRKSASEEDSHHRENKKIFSSFKLRMLVYFLLPVALISFLTIVFASALSQRIIFTNANAQNENVLKTFSNELHRSILNKDFSAAEALLNKAIEKNNYNSIILRDASKRAVLSLQNPILKISTGVSSLTHQLIIRGPQNQTEVWQLEFLRQAGVVEKLTDMFFHFQFLIIMAMVLVSIISIFLVFDYLILSPLGEISTALKKLTAGSKTDLIDYEYKDEVGETIYQLNRFIQSHQDHEIWLQMLQEQGNTVNFELNPATDSLLFHCPIIPGTPIKTSEINTLDDLCNALQPSKKAECKESLFDLKERIQNLDSGNQSFEFHTYGLPQEMHNQEAEIWLRITFCWGKRDGKTFCGGVILNITKEKNQEIAAIQSEEKFRKIYDNFPIGIWRSRGESYIYVNLVMAELLGYSSPSEAISKIKSITHEVYLRPEDRTFFFDEMKKNGEVKNLEMRFKKSDGKIFWGAIHGKIHRDQQGFYAEGGFMEVTERKESEESLRNNEENLRLGLEAAGAITYLLDLSDNKIFFKGPVIEVLGEKISKQMTIKDFQKLIHPDDFQSFPPRYDSTAKKEKIGENSHFVQELRICVSNKDGELETRWLRLSFNFYNFSTQNRPRQQRGTIVDITEQKLNEHELEESKISAEQSSRMKSEFFADISHDIRTPLNAIIGFSELLSPELQSPPHNGYIRSILSASRSLLNIINDILDLAKLESGKIEILSEQVSIEVLARETKALFTAEADKKGLELEIVIDDSVPSIVMLDEIRIKQVLNNLVGNAIKFTENGKISITFSASPARLKRHTDLIISVEDTGIGIAHTDKNEIFKPFRQRKGQGGKMGGTGLGLAICKRLIEVMDGKITLTSDPGKGSKFEIRMRNIEIEKLMGNLRPESVSKARLFQFANQRVLVVDDAISNRELLTEALSAVGLDVFSAKDGAEAVELAKQNDPELIIMDIRMPVKDGIQATKEIKAYKNIPIIALTASVGTMEDKYKEIFNGFLHKPIKLYDLFSEAGRFLKFSLKESETETKTRKETAPAIAFEQIVNPNELTKKLNKQILSDLKDFEGAMSIDEVKVFAEQIKGLATEHSFNLLALEAEELIQGATHFDTSKIKHSLKKVGMTLNHFLNFFKKAEDATIID